MSRRPDFRGLRASGNLLLRLLNRHSVQECGIRECARTKIRLVGNAEGFRVLAGGNHDRYHRQAVAIGEVQVALIVRSAAKHRTGAVIEQHEISHIHRELAFRIERMADLEPGMETALLRLTKRLFRARLLPARPCKGREPGNMAFDFPRKRMIRGKRDEACPENRVVPRGEDLDGIPSRSDFTWLKRKFEPKAFTPAYPVALHEPDPVRPSLEPILGRQQLLGEIRNPEEPLRHLPALDDCVRAPAAPVDHLLVRENGRVDRVPIDDRAAPIDTAGFKEIEEQRLLRTVVFDIAGGEFTAPVQGEPHAAKLFPHGRDIVAGPASGVDSAIPCGILRRKPERIPAHGMQHAEPLGPLVAGEDVPERVVADMPHVDTARRVRKHLQNVVFLA